MWAAKTTQRAPKMAKIQKQGKNCHECGLEAIDPCETGKGHIHDDENLAPCVYCVRNRLEHTRTNCRADFYSETWTGESDKTPIMQDPDPHEQTLLRTLHNHNGGEVIIMATPENIIQIAKDNKAKKKEKKSAVQEEGKAHKAEDEQQDKKAEKPLFPAEGKINKYGFIYLGGDVLKAFDLGKGVERKLSIDIQGKKLNIKKA